MYVYLILDPPGTAGVKLGKHLDGTYFKHLKSMARPSHWSPDLRSALRDLVPASVGSFGHWFRTRTASESQAVAVFDQRG